MLSEFILKHIARKCAFSAFRAAHIEPTNEEFNRLWQLIANAIMMVVPGQPTEREAGK